MVLALVAQMPTADPQALHHVLAKAGWSIETLRDVRLALTRQALRERPFILCSDLCSDETGDRTKGTATEYAASQYIGNVHSLATGVVAVNASSVRARQRHRSAGLGPSASTSRAAAASSQVISIRASRSWLERSFRN